MISSSAQHITEEVAALNTKASELKLKMASSTAQAKTK